MVKAVRIKGVMGKHFDSVFLDTGAGYRRLSPRPSQRLYNHSPDGFAWGYGGSGPAQLALAVLLATTGDPDYALDHYQEFKRTVIATVDFGRDFELIADLPVRKEKVS